MNRKMIGEIYANWKRWKNDWDSLCSCCGKCCYARSVETDGSVTIHYMDPCEHLDTETHRCRVYENRFRECNHCGKVNLWTALFNPTLPEDCTYVQTFRLWKYKD